MRADLGGVAAWAAATLLEAAAGRRVLRSAHADEPRHLAQLMWAAAVCRGRFALDLLAVALWPVAEAALAYWSLATLGAWLQPWRLGWAPGAVHAELALAPPQAAANLIWALAKVLQHDARVVAAVARLAPGRFNNQEVCNVAWALTCVDELGSAKPWREHAVPVLPSLCDAEAHQLCWACGKAMACCSCFDDALVRGLAAGFPHAPNAAWLWAGRRCAADRASRLEEVLRTARGV